MDAVGLISTFFELPTKPDGFSVPLVSAELRKLNFSAMDYHTVRRAIIEYLQTHFPDDFNDYVASNGYMMLIETCAHLVSLLALRSDILASDATLPTSNSKEAVINHLALINQQMHRQTPATTDILCSVRAPILTDIQISAGLVLSVVGDDGKSIYYEIFRSPGDFVSPIVIPAGKRGVVAFGIEGRSATTTFSSDGVANQLVSVVGRDILDVPITVTVDGINWRQVDYVEKYNGTDKVFSVQIYDDRMDIAFGDNVHGMIPSIGSSIVVTYRQGGGIRGRVGAGVISASRPISPGHPYTAPVQVTFTNGAPSVGGSDAETIEQAKRRAPREAATHYSATTERDYTQLAANFSHPVFGTIAKAIAAVRTGVRANVVDVYALSVDGDNRPVAPSEGLKTALATYFKDINVATDSIFVHAASIKPIDLKLNVIMHAGSDASIIKGKVEAAIDSFFDINNWSLGQALHVSQIYNNIMRVDGVAYVDVFSPSDNLLSIKSLSSDGTDTNGVYLDQLIVLANREISYYYERS